MYRILLIATILFFGLNAESQQKQEYFVFIQDMARQPFYVRMGEVSHSSSAMGHIIVSNLRDSVYNFFIGFPKGRSPEQLFTVTIDKKDHGYELRNMDGRWQLFDLQTLQLISPASSSQHSGQTVMRSDSYSALMANVVDDSAVLFSAIEDTLTTDTVKIAAEVRAVAQTAVQSTDDNIASDTAAANSNVPQAPVVIPTSSVRDNRDIIRLITENVPGGRMMIYVDRSGPVSDTIRIVIPR